MAINRFLSRTALATLAVTAALASCSSVEPSPGKTARVGIPSPDDGAPAPPLDTAQATSEVAAASEGAAMPDAPLAKTGRIHIAVPDSPSVASIQTAAMASPEMAPQVAYAAINPVATTTAAAALQTVALPAGQAVGASTANLLAPPASAEPLAAPTSELRTQALAADEDELTPDMQALQAAIPIPRPDIAASAYAAKPSQPAALATLQAVDTRTQFPPAPGEPLPGTASASPPEISALIKRYAGIYGVPESLIHRVVHRESRYNPKAYHKNGYWGLMQIKYATAKSMGYSGPPEGLLDAETNIKYATKYLRGAWLVADNSNDNAIRLYARGYYYDAKRKGMLHVLQQ
jgi:soluble lytic murein transglycosylase-like protein